MRVTRTSVALGLGMAVITVLALNRSLTAVCLAVLLFGHVMLKGPRTAPVLYFVFAYQWLQSSALLLHANLLNEPINSLGTLGGDVQLSTLLSLLAVAALVLGMRVGSRLTRQPVVMAAPVSPDILRRCIILYAGTAVLAGVAQTVARATPSLAQPLLALASLKWAAYWLLTYTSFLLPAKRWVPWVCIFMLELGLGLGGYFSDFRAVLFISVLALLSSGLRFGARRAVTVAVLSALTLAMGLAWTAVKYDYRQFVSDGERAQVVRVSYLESLEFLASRVAALDAEQIIEAAEKLAARVAYVEIFGRVTDMVPEAIPYQHGEIWLDALARPFMPRILFPEKSAINDSDRTREFSGVSFMTAEEGTSVAIGYVGESYVDFGPVLMFFPIALLGWCLGFVYRKLAQHRAAIGPIGLALATAVLVPAAQLETSITKSIGGLLVSLLVAVATLWAIRTFKPKLIVRP